MLVLFLVGIFLAASFEDVVGQTPDPPADQSEIESLRSMLLSAVEQNRQLQSQNNRMKLIWSGLQQMCGALAKCDCQSPTPAPATPSVQIPTETTPTVTPPTTNPPLPETTTPAPEPVHEKLRIVAITSSGSFGDDPVNVSVHYVASEEHTVEWLVLRKNGGMMRTNGLNGRYEVGNNTYRYFSRLDFQSVNNTRQALIRIYSGSESASMRLNLTAILEAGDQFIPEPEADFLLENETYVAPIASDLNITLSFAEDPRRNPDFAGSQWEIFFTGLNISNDPNTVFETHVVPRSGNAGIGLSLQPGNNASRGPDMIVTLRYPYAQYGGILTIRLPKRIGGYIRELYQGKFIKVLNPITEELVPYGSIGVFPLPAQTYVFPPSQSIICASMGNPRPEVSILRLFNDGTYIEPPADTLIMDEVTHMKSLTLLSDTASIVEGAYVCRASNGNTTVDTQTDVFVFQQAVFEDTSTGVNVNNDTFTVVVTCEATGKPRPEVQMRLYNEFGPDIAAAGLYPVSRENIGLFTTRLSITLSPADIDVSTVYCAAIQKSSGTSYENFRMMEIFPGVRKNWEFYNRTLNMRFT